MQRPPLLFVEEPMLLHVFVVNILHAVILTIDGGPSALPKGAAFCYDCLSSDYYCRRFWNCIFRHLSLFHRRRLPGVTW